MARTVFFGVGMALCVWVPALGASPQLATDRYSIAGGLQANSDTASDRYSISLRAATPEEPGERERAELNRQSTALPTPRFELTAELRSSGSAEGPAGSCVIDDLFKSGFESP